MREPKPIAGARALLFDRLVDLHPEIREEERPFRILNRNQLKVSIRRELERLLNTRCSLSLERVGEEDRSVVNYGIPDFSSLSPSNADGLRTASATSLRRGHSARPRRSLCPGSNEVRARRV